MSIKLYWGANGSYKSASAVQDDIIPELKKGRVVVTNIRGCTLERVMEQYPDLPDTADVINIDTTKPSAYKKLRTWFRWAPHGALIVLDEIQLIHKKSWREKELNEFILRVNDNGQERLATEEEAEQLKQPYDMLTAFTMHRHFNWDIVFTTPNIKYLRDDIRGTTETAYRQANGALLGSLTAGKFKRSMHDADLNRPPSDSLVQTLKINQKSFACYQSTSTGKVQDTRAGTNIFKSPRLLLALACSLGGFAYAFGSGGFAALDNSSAIEVINDPVKLNANVVSRSVEVDSISSNVHTTSANGDVFDLRSSEKLNDIVYPEPFTDYEMSLSFYYDAGFNRNEFAVYQVLVSNEQGFYTYNTNQLISMGYKVNLLSECMLRLQWDSSVRYVSCMNEYYKEPQEEPIEESLPEVVPQVSV